MSAVRDEMEKIYQTIPPGRIPWNIEVPPDALVELVDSGKVSPGKTIDLGCGAGHYAIYLAGRGFDVLGVDISPTAIRIAREHAERRRVAVRFVVADMLGDLHEIQDSFDFAYDWEVLHHIYPEKREIYIRNVYRLLTRGARYLSVCFSEKSPQFGGEGKYRTTPLGTVLYFSSEDELRSLFGPFFTIIDLKTITISGKYGPHLVNYAFMERR